MDKLIDYISEELDELEKKAGKGKLSVTEIQYGDMLAHFKKSLLTSDAMEDGGYSGTGRSYGYPQYHYDDGNMDNGRSNDSRPYEGRSYEGRSYAGRRYARRDSRGRYSRSYGNEYSGDMVEQLKGLMDEAPDENTRQEIQRLVSKMENM